MRARLLLGGSTLLLGALALACGGDPMADDAATYATAMGPALDKNMALAQHMLEVAAQLKKKEVDAEGIHKRWSKEVVPLADQLKADAEAIQPATPQLLEVHQGLINAWTARSEAYHAIDAAWTANDTSAFDKASSANIEAKLAEEAYFANANALLEPYGFHLDQFPGT